MTRYLLSVWHDGDPTPPEPEVMETMFAQVDAFNAELEAAGAWVFAGGLHPPSSAAVVRAADGQVSVTDGPYAEAKVQIGGFWIIQAPDLDAALAWAGKGATACMGPVEVRPFQGEQDRRAMAVDGECLGQIYRREVGRCTATLVRIPGDVDLAEDAVAGPSPWPPADGPSRPCSQPWGWITTNGPRPGHRGPAAGLDALAGVDRDRYHLFYSPGPSCRPGPGIGSEARDALDLAPERMTTRPSAGWSSQRRATPDQGG